MAVGARSEILTFLIADVRGYTSFTQTHGDEAAAQLAAAFAEIAREGVEAHGGEVIELRGDEALAVFRSAPDALRAAADLQVVFADEIELHPELPLRVGIGLDAGPAVPVEDGYRGAALNLAARLCSKAGPGEVLASDGLVRMAGPVDGVSVHELGELEMKGLDEPVRVSRVAPAEVDPDMLVGRFTLDGRTSVAPTELPPGLDTTTPIVGRERELHRLRWTWRRARRGEGSACFVLGPSGIGKTRLLAELAATATHDGAEVRHASFQGTRDPALVATAAWDEERPTLLVLDDVEAGRDAVSTVRDLVARIPGSSALVVAALEDSALSSELRELVDDVGGTVVRPAALGLDDVRAIAELYIGASARDLPASLLESTGGVPRRIHRQVSEWAFAEASRRLGAAASRAAAGRSDLRSVESELAGNVVDLQLIRERARRYMAGYRRSDAEPSGSPFKGLASFDVDDADLFFGRERLVGELVARLAGAPLLGVVGPSGSGKSSAVRAGLIPSIRSGVLPGSEGWTVALMRPGEHPVAELGRSLSDTLGASEPVDGSMLDMLDRLPPDGRVVLVVDQFEEAFTTCPDETERAIFLGALAGAANDPGGRVAVVLAIRADFYGRCAEDPALAELVGANHVLVGPMTPDEYRRAIEQPALRVGVAVEPALTEALVAEVGDEPGALPLLSTALLELWERREGRSIRLRAYLETGGVRGAVSRLAEEVFGSFTREQQAVVRAVMLRLAAPSEGDTVVRRRVPLAEFDAERNPDVAHVVDVLTDRRLLTVSEGVVEVAHEALLREWPRLRVWLDEDRAGRVLHAHLMETAREWVGADRDPSELYRGARLASALDWTSDHTLELNELEREFLNASRLASERETERQRRANRRLRGLLAGVAVFLVVALAAGGLALVQRGKAERAARSAIAQRLGAQALVEKDLDRSLLLARQAVAIDQSPATEGNLLAALVRAPAAVAIRRPLPGRVLQVEVSADGRYVLAGNNEGRYALLDPRTLETIRTWSSSAFPTFGSAPSATLGVSDQLIEFAFSDAGRSVNTIDPETGQVTELFRYQPEIDRAWISANLERAIGTVEGTTTATVWDVASGAEAWTLRSSRDRPFIDVWIAPDGDHALTVHHIGPLEEGQDPFVFTEEVLAAGTIELWWWERAAERPVLTIPPLEPGYAPFGLSPDLRWLALGTRERGSVTLVDLRSGVQRELNGRHNAAVQGLGFSPDGTALVTTGDDNQVIVWDVESGSIIEVLQGHNGRVFGPAFTPDGTRVFTASLDGSVIAWDLAGERALGRRAQAPPIRTQETEADNLSPPAISPDGKMLAVQDGSGGVGIYDASTLEELRRIDVSASRVWALAFSPDGTRLAAGDQGGAVTLWDTTSWERAAGPFSGPTPDGTEIIRALAFSPDGSTLAAGTHLGPVFIEDPRQVGGRLYVWDVSSEAPRTDPLDPGGEVTALVFDPTGELLAGTWNGPDPAPEGFMLGSATVWDARDLTELYWVDVDSGYGRAAAVTFSSDGSLLATGGGTGDVRFFDAASGATVGRDVAAVSGWVFSVDFDPGGSRLVAAGTDGTTRLIDVPTRSQIGAPLPGRDQEATTAVFTPDGARVITIDGTGTIRVWEVAPSAWARAACAVAGRTLTREEWQRFLSEEPYAPACSG